MNLEDVRSYCLKKKGVTETMPFDEETPVYKVKSRMFLLANLTPPISINIKCDPETAVELREKYDAVQPGYHMNKKHWNTVMLDNSVRDYLIYEWIDNSYELVKKGLKKSELNELENE